jgi:hypothetical protein
VRKVIDYSGWRPSDLELAALGIEGMTRYLSRVDPNKSMTTWPNSKILLKPEYDHLLALGYTVLLNWEWFAARWLAGYAGGVEDGREARRQARALGAPDSAVIVQSVDTNIATNQYGVACEYQRGFNDGGGCGPQGIYGTDGLLRVAVARGLVKVCWQAAARGWVDNANDSPVANLIQRHALSTTTYGVDEVRTPHWGAVNECAFGYRCVMVPA